MQEVVSRTCKTNQIQLSLLFPCQFSPKTRDIIIHVRVCVWRTYTIAITTQSFTCHTQSSILPSCFVSLVIFVAQHRKQQSNKNNNNFKLWRKKIMEKNAHKTAGTSERNETKMHFAIGACMSARACAANAHRIPTEAIMYSIVLHVRAARSFRLICVCASHKRALITFLNIFIYLHRYRSQVSAVCISLLEYAFMCVCVLRIKLTALNSNEHNEIELE